MARNGREENRADEAAEFAAYPHLGDSTQPFKSRLIFCNPRILSIGVVVLDNLCNIAEHGRILIDALESVECLLVLPLEKKPPSLFIKSFEALLDSKEVVRIFTKVYRRS